MTAYSANELCKAGTSSVYVASHARFFARLCMHACRFNPVHACMHAGLTQCMAMKETPAKVFCVRLMRLLKMQDTALRK